MLVGARLSVRVSVVVVFYGRPRLAFFCCPVSVSSPLPLQFDNMSMSRELNAYFPISQGLTKLLQLDRISASQALQLVRDNCGNIEHSE